MEQPSSSMETSAESEATRGSHVPPEVIDLMKNGIWPSVKMADLLYDSLLKKPRVIFHTESVAKLLGADIFYYDGEKVAKRVRQRSKD